MKNKINFNSSFVFLPAILLFFTTLASSKGTVSKLYTSFDGDLIWSAVLTVLIVGSGFIGIGFGATMLGVIRREFKLRRLLGCIGGFVIGIGAISTSLWTESSYSIESLRDVNPVYFQIQDKIDLLESSLPIGVEAQGKIDQLNEAAAQVGDGWILMSNKFGIDIYIFIITFFLFTEAVGAFCGWIVMSKIVTDNLTKVEKESSVPDNFVLN